jgi:hypothetical protein
MKRLSITCAVLAILSCALVAETHAGWGRTLMYVPPPAVPAVVVTNRVVVPPTYYYGPPAGYYAPSTSYYAPTTSYYAPATVYSSPTVVAPGSYLAPSAFRLRPAAPGPYVTPTYVAP